MGLGAQTNVSIETILELAADYLEAYSRQFSSVVSEEAYAQMATTGKIKTFRTLRSDVMLVNAGEVGWLNFRDVFEVDGRSVRDRDDRILQLFLHPSEAAIQQATKILDEGARFNIGPIKRTINVPTMALPFLRRQNQPRSAFYLDDDTSVNGVRTHSVRFSEQVMPRMIHTSDNSPTGGQFWIETSTGRVVKTELVLDSDDAHGVITVTYAPQPGLNGLWVPIRMEERYSVGAARSIDCTAIYSRFRQFNVDAATKFIR